jgi:hypothetical protein
MTKAVVNKERCRHDLYRRVTALWPVPARTRGPQRNFAGAVRDGRGPARGDCPGLREEDLTYSPGFSLRSAAAIDRRSG